MPEQPRTPDRSVLGESWVMASTASIKKESKDSQEPASPSPQPKPEQINDPRSTDGGKTTTQSTESLTSSSWTVSGPELIMPSIYEVAAPEASWVALVRSKDRTSSGTMRKRRKISSGDQQEHQQDTGHRSPNAGSSPKQTAANASKQSLISNVRQQSTLVRRAINGLLIALILHLLVLPELISQAQDLCHLPTVKTLYPDSCVRLNPRPFHPSNPIITPEETITAAQSHLESIFTSTLETLTPLSHILKESESMLADLQLQLQTTFPDARNALDLEFQGSEQALHAATWEFDSLRADLRSAIDSLLASPPAQESSTPSITRDTRLAAQLRRRAEYLDRLRAQLRSKADSLGSRFAALDDHLEAVDGIVAREGRRALLLGTNEPRESRLHSVLRSLAAYASFGGDLFRVRSRSLPGNTVDSSAQNPGAVHRPATTRALLRLAATHHRPVADSVTRLSRQLRGVQGARLGPTW